MERMVLNAEERVERGSGALGQVRRDGWVPAVLYGKGITPQNLKVKAKEISKLLAHSESVHQMMDLQVASAKGVAKKWVVMLKDYQIDILDRQFRHIDFCKVDLAKALQVKVPIHLIGKAAGLQKGGVVELLSREIEVECLPDKIPQHLEVDITALDIGDSVHVKEINLPQGVTLAPGTDFTVVSVVKPREEEVAAAPTVAAPVEGAPAADAAGAAPAAGADAKDKGAPAKGAAPAKPAAAGEKKDSPKKS